MIIEDFLQHCGIVTLLLAVKSKRHQIKYKHMLWHSRIVAWEHVESCVSDEHSVFRDEFTVDQKICFLTHLTLRVLRLCGADLSLQVQLYPLPPTSGNEMNCLKLIETNQEFLKLWETIHGEKDCKDLMHWVNKMKAAPTGAAA